MMQAASSAVQQQSCRCVVALQNFQAGRLDEAERLFGKVSVATLWPCRQSAFCSGRLLTKPSAANWLAELIGKAIAINPREASSHSNLGNLLLHQGRLDEAVACYHRALRLRPNFPEALNNLGNALRAPKRLDEAVISYRIALSI